MIAVARIVSAMGTSDDELVAIDDDERAQEWAASRHTLLVLCVSRRAELYLLISRTLCIAGPGDADGDGVCFRCTAASASRSASEHEIVALKADRLLSINPWKLEGGRLMVARDELDEQQLATAETLTAYYPTQRQCDALR